MTIYHFAWVDADATSFLPSHVREDEAVLAFELSHSEGEFATLSIEIRNPRKGLLNASRKQWAWFSADFGSGAEALFFGRLVAMPEDIIGNAVRLTFRARPDDFADARQAVADALKVAPYWDPVWIMPDVLDDADAVLESRSALWHIDRVSHQVTISDVLTAEDGVIDLGGNVIRDSLELAYGAPPASSISCEAVVGWEQSLTGSFDLVPALLAAFKAAGTDTANVISSFTGQGLMEDWPKPGTRIGGGWSFGKSAISRVDGFTVPKDFETQVFTTNGLWGQKAEWPCWKMKPVLRARYDASRGRTEVLRFTLVADTQAFVADPDDSEPLTLTLSSDLVGAPVDSGDKLPIGSRRNRAYFPTERGLRSVAYLVAVCRARLRARARSVEIKGETSLARGRNFSCRKAIRIEDPRLPGGAATGKIISYTLSMSGDGGEAIAGFVIGCSLGKGNSIAAAIGTPAYVAGGYVETGWQRYAGASTAVVAGEVTVADFSDIAPDDDGIDFDHLTEADVIDAITVINGERDQRALIRAYNSSYKEVAEAFDQAFTEIILKLKPIAKGPFETVYDITVSRLALPKTIDLEAA